MGRVIAKSLSDLTAGDIKFLNLGPGVCASEVVPGCNIYEPFGDNGARRLRGLVIHRSPKGNQIVTVKRAHLSDSPVITLHKINFRYYDKTNGRINHGSVCQAYFKSLGDTGYDIIDTKLTELGE